MKQLIIVIGIGVITILSSMIILSQNNKTNRKDELNRAVSAAVKQTVKASQINGQKEIVNNKDMVAQFIQLISTNINSDSDISVEIMGVDYNSGMLDVIVTERFKYLNGKKDEVSVRKCAIYE